MKERFIQKAILAVATSFLLNAGCQPPPQNQEPNKLGVSIAADIFKGEDEISDYQISLPYSRLDSSEGTIMVILKPDSFANKLRFEQVLPPEGQIGIPVRAVHLYELSNNVLSIKIALATGADSQESITKLKEFTRNNPSQAEIWEFKPELSYLIQGDWNKNGYRLGSVRANNQDMDRRIIPGVRPSSLPRA